MMQEEIDFVNSSKYRPEILKSLDKQVLMPSQLAKDFGIRTCHVSNVLKPLKEHDLIECVNPEASKGRLYRLTKKGKEVVNKLYDST